MNQWHVAPLRPPHLAALCIWEGSSDYYRELARHGGILCDFLKNWSERQVTNVQYGVGERGPKSPVTGELVAGPETLPEAQLAANRADVAGEALARRLIDDYYRDRTPDFGKIEVPILSAANWGGQGLHPRGNFEGYLAAGSSQKWLEVHGDTHFSHFYTDYGAGLQKRFFGHFLKNEDTGWQDQPPVSLHARRVDGTFEQRAETEWPLARTEWTKFHLDVTDNTLSTEPGHAAKSVEFDALGEGLTFWTETLTDELELTGPAAAALTVASSTTDADLFITLRVQDPDGQDVTFPSAMDPRGGAGFGWLRASLRKLDPERSEAYRPWHAFDERQPLVPGEPVDLQVEIWPNSVIIPAGYRLGVTVGGRDFEFPGDGPWPAAYGISMRGNGIFVHTDPEDRGSEVYAGKTTLTSGSDHPSYLLLPVIPRPAG
jgi:predicted acyl esterase